MKNLPGPRCGSGKGDLRAVAEHSVRYAEALAEPWPKERQWMWRPEQDHVGSERHRALLDPVGDRRRRPHERRGVPADPVIGFGIGIDGCDDVDLVRVGVDEVAEILLNPARFRRVVIRDEQQAHGQVPRWDATLYEERRGPPLPEMISACAVLRGTGSTSRSANGMPSIPAT
jgi:hypothetical protein